MRACCPTAAALSWLLVTVQGPGPSCCCGVQPDSLDWASCRVTFPHSGRTGLPLSARPHSAAPLPRVWATDVSSSREEVGPEGLKVTRRGTHTSDQGTPQQRGLSDTDLHRTSAMCLLRVGSGDKGEQSSLPLEVRSSGWGQDAACWRWEKLHWTWLRHEGRLPGGSSDWAEL